jgi:uncharacterized protein YjeT (DUF2065 family)
VEILDLSHNNLCEQAGLLLGPAISDNASIKELDLSWNHLRRKGAVAIAAGVKVSVQGHEKIIRIDKVMFANFYSVVRNYYIVVFTELFY